MSEVAQFGSAPGRGTEETICKSLAHIDEARARTATDQRVAGQGTRGVKLKGSPTLSVDMGKAFDTVYRVRVREALEVASADPFLIDVVGKLHTETFYEMTTLPLDEESNKPANLHPHCLPALQTFVRPVRPTNARKDTNHVC